MFKEKLNTKIALTISGTTTTISAGNIKSFSVDMTPWGYTAECEFWIVCVKDPSEDKLFATFVVNDLMSVQFDIARGFDEVGDNQVEKPKPLTLKGLVVDRRVLERNFPKIQGNPVMHRRYWVRFADTGQVLWSQHRPCMLYVDKTLKDLITDNVPTGVTIDHQWQASSVQYPVLSLPGDPRRHDLGLDVQQSDSTFYDYLHWLCDGLYVGLYYDPPTDKYTIADAKPTGTADPLERTEVQVLETVFEPIRRDTVSTKNGYTEAATNTKDITNSVSVSGVKTHYLIRSAITSDLDARTTLETSRCKQHEPGARIEMARYHAAPLTPGNLIKLDDNWSPNLFQYGKQYRIVNTHLSAKALRQQATDDNLAVTNNYDIDHRHEVELDTDPVVRHPPYRTPVWPFYVEGKVLSETGATNELTFQPYQNSQTSLYYYKIKIPLWSNITVIVPYEPNKLPQKLFVPYQRDERVLISLFHDHARIRASLEWRPDGGQLPTDQQGDHVLVGKTGDKNMTTVSHTYVDSKPVVTMQRKLDDDTQTMTISEGKISWVVKDH